MMTQVRKRIPATPKQAARSPGPLDTLLDPELFKALGDPTRVRLMACLMKCGRPCSVSEIAACCSVDLSVVSRHLQVLERSGVLESTRQGRTVSYAVKFQDLCTILRSLADAVEQCRPASHRNATAACCGSC